MTDEEFEQRLRSECHTAEMIEACEREHMRGRKWERGER